MATINKLDSALGIAKQTVQGTPAAAPTIVVPLIGGAVAGFDASKTVDPETGQVYSTNAFLDTIASGFDVSTRAYPEMLGISLMGVLGKCVTTGAAAPFTHVFTPDKDTPWHTFWGYVGAQTVQSTDAKFDKLSISWSGNKPLDLQMTLAALGIEFDVPMTGGVEVAGTKYFTPANGVFKISAHDGTPVETAITAFSAELSRDVSAEYYSGDPMPGDLSTGRFKAAPSITIKPSDLAAFKAAATGSPTGTTPSKTIVYGSYEVNLTIDAGTTLKIESPRVPFAVSWPESDPSGGAVELELKAEDSLGTATIMPITVTLTDSVTTY